jgi:hypothetical protein
VLRVPQADHKSEQGEKHLQRVGMGHAGPHPELVIRHQVDASEEAGPTHPVADGEVVEDDEAQKPADNRHDSQDDRHGRERRKAEQPGHGVNRRGEHEHRAAVVNDSVIPQRPPVWRNPLMSRELGIQIVCGISERPLDTAVERHGQPGIIVRGGREHSGIVYGARDRRDVEKCEEEDHRSDIEVDPKVVAKDACDNAERFNQTAQAQRQLDPPIDCDADRKTPLFCRSRHFEP